MRPRHSFARGVGFAFLAALATPTAVLLLAPVFGGERALAVSVVVLAAVSVALLARRPRERAQVALLALAFGALALVFAHGRAEAFLGAGVVVGVCRGVCFGAGSRVRAAATELALVAGGLGLAHLVAGPGLVGAMLGVWAFHLVQALHPLVAGRAGLAARGAARGEPGEPDTFERARARLDAWLEGVAPGE